MHTSIESLQKKIGYVFTEPKHAACLIEDTGDAANKRGALSVLGDKIIEVAIRFYLEEKYPEASRKELRKHRHMLASNRIIGEFGKELGLGKVEEHIHDNATFYEALVAAISQDGGFEKAVEFAGKHLRTLDLGPQTASNAVSNANAAGDLHILLQKIGSVHKISASQRTETFQANPNSHWQVALHIKLGDEQEQVFAGSGHNLREATRQAAGQALVPLQDRFPNLIGKGRVR